ncbi:MAG: phosphotransferase family protein [Myxococcota bacterium]|nr:phosphotransferase family protein [Myxococcota bacterium]
MSMDGQAHLDDGIERARETRAAEALDGDRLLSYLGPILPGLEQATILQFPNGHSNLTYLLKGSTMEYVLRRPPIGANVPTGHDMSREYRILSALHPHWAKVPRPYHYCDDPSIMGTPFYVMERVDGIILRGPKHRSVALDRAYMEQACTTLIDTLVEIHGLDVHGMGLTDFGRPHGYIERQLEGWHQRYVRAQTDDLPAIDRIAAWLKTHQPQESAPTLIHNDFKYDNCVFAAETPTRAEAVLDWEMCTVGCPLMDLGTTLAYWVESQDPAPMHMMPFGPTMLPGNLSRQGVVDRYEHLSGRTVQNPVFYYVYGLFKVVGIAQQIYHRYVHGLTADPRFAMMIEAVKLLGQQGCIAIDKGRLSQL